MRQLIWPILTLVLMGASFGGGRVAGGFRGLPAMIATLPGDESGFSREFDERIRARFPIGSSEDALIEHLAGEDFAPQWRRRDAANASVFVSNGLVCKKIIRVNWRADASGVLADVSGAYESRCL